MTSLLCNWFDDWGRNIKSGLTITGIIVFLVAFFCFGVLLFYGIIKRALVANKNRIAWGLIFLLIIDILFFIWFCIII